MHFLAMARQPGRCCEGNHDIRLVTVSPDDSVNRVMNLMTHHRVRHMPVLRGGRWPVSSASGMSSSIDWRIWSLRRTSYVMSTTLRVDGLGVGP